MALPWPWLPTWFWSCGWLTSAVTARKALAWLLVRVDADHVQGALKALRCVTVWCWIEAQTASAGRQIWKHGYGNLLRDMGLASIPQQASATVFLYTTRQLFCVVSQYQCAGNPSIGNNYRVAVPPFVEGYHSWGTTSRRLVRHCILFWIWICWDSFTLTTTTNLCAMLAPGHSRVCRCNESQQQASASPDISLLKPELQKQWHHAKNQHLGDKQITANNNMRVWWNLWPVPMWAAAQMGEQHR